MELKPCPFCGSEARFLVSEQGICVKCTGGFEKGCGCQTPWVQDNPYIPDDCAVSVVENIWNRRVENS